MYVVYGVDGMTAAVEGNGCSLDLLQQSYGLDRIWAKNSPRLAEVVGLF